VIKLSQPSLKFESISDQRYSTTIDTVNFLSAVTL